MLMIIVSTGILLISILLLIKNNFQYKPRLLITVAVIALIAAIVSWTYWLLPIRIDIPANAPVHLYIHLTDGSTAKLDQKQMEDIADLLRTIEFRHTTANKPMLFATQTRILAIDGSGLTRRGNILIYIQNGDPLTGFVDFGGTRLAIAYEDMEKIKHTFDEMDFKPSLP